MEPLETLYFPDTVIRDNGRLFMLLLFDCIHLLQPMERDADEQRAAGHLDSFMDQRFCQVHTPAPLGPDRDRFLRLVRDIKERKDDYAAQLSSLTLASMSVSEPGGRESKQEIISSLFGIGTTGPAADEQEEQRQSELWQARLVLAIAELLDREEEEISQALGSLELSQTDLFDRLLGTEDGFEEGSPFADLSRLPEKMPLPRSGNDRNRLRAWLILLAAAKFPVPWLWMTDRIEAADMILEMSEKRCGRQAEQVLELELPAATGDNTQNLSEKINIFKEEAKALTAEISGHLHTLATTHQPGSPVPTAQAADWRERWHDLLETRFPAASYGRIPVNFHLLPESSPADPGAVDSLQGDRNNRIRHTILAVIGPEKNEV